MKDQRELNQLQSQVAQQLAPMVYDQVGMLTRDQPPEVKVAVHTVIGGLLAQAMGGSFAAGAAGDAVATAAAELVGQQILNNPDLQTLSEQDRKALVQIAGTIVAAGAGAAVGGTTQDAAAAGAAGGWGRSITLRALGMALPLLHLLRHSHRSRVRCPASRSMMGTGVC
ncbi:hypothetical protein ACKI2N_023540 [Cupriavidus sp. 30B13]|uniref:hypothetical protein n=1 Tax=Cupriavidus sp. 30B13 TaxID=3384241 RepID=UPI003B8FD944